MTRRDQSTVSIGRQASGTSDWLVRSTNTTVQSVALSAPNNCYGRHRRPVTRSNGLIDTLGIWATPRPAARSDRLLWSIPPASGTL